MSTHIYPIVNSFSRGRNICKHGVNTEMCLLETPIPEFNEVPNRSYVCTKLKHPWLVELWPTHWEFLLEHGPLARYARLRIAHAPGMPGTFSPSPQVSDPDMYHGTCVTHVPWCMPGSLTSGFLWNRRRGKTFPAFPAHAHPQFYVSGKRPMMALSGYAMDTASHIIG